MPSPLLRLTTWMTSVCVPVSMSVVVVVVGVVASELPRWLWVSLVSRLRVHFWLLLLPDVFFGSLVLTMDKRFNGESVVFIIISKERCTLEPPTLHERRCLTDLTRPERRLVPCTWNELLGNGIIIIMPGIMLPLDGTGLITFNGRPDSCSSSRNMA